MLLPQAAEVDVLEGEVPTCPLSSLGPLQSSVLAVFAASKTPTAVPAVVALPLRLPIAYRPAEA